MGIRIKRAVTGLAAITAFGLGVPAQAEAPDPAGEWHGAVQAPTGPLMLVVYVTKTPTAC